MNWKTILGSLGICTLIGGWMVTASISADNKIEIRETKKEVRDLHDIVVEQRAMNTAQVQINETLTKVLRELQERNNG